MVSNTEATIIAELLYRLDTSVRNDLHLGLIADERDYVSRLITHFNYPFGLFNFYSISGLKFKTKWLARVNKSNEEQKFGCDSMIVFRVNNFIKIGMFEAKWPRVKINNKYKWDYPQKSTKKSHFTSQIKRQSKWSNEMAIWEMFFYEDKPGYLNQPYDEFASTCIKHEFANQYVKTNSSVNTIWNNTDLENLIKLEQNNNPVSTRNTNLKEIILDLLGCKIGKRKQVEPNDRFVNISSNDESEKVRIPILTFEKDSNTEGLISEFMESTNLSLFLQMNIDNKRME